MRKPDESCFDDHVKNAVDMIGNNNYKSNVIVVYPKEYEALKELSK